MNDVRRPTWAEVAEWADKNTTERLADWEAILDFERMWANRAPDQRGHYEQSIRAVFGVNKIRYNQVLLRVINNPDALAHDPMTVHHLQDRLTAGHHARKTTP